jgi:hypothetical protein
MPCPSVDEDSLSWVWVCSLSLVAVVHAPPPKFTETAAAMGGDLMDGLPPILFIRYP